MLKSVLDMPQLEALGLGFKVVTRTDYLELSTKRLREINVLGFDYERVQIRLRT